MKNIFIAVLVIIFVLTNLCFAEIEYEGCPATIRLDKILPHIRWNIIILQN